MPDVRDDEAPGRLAGGAQRPVRGLAATYDGLLAVAATAFAADAAGLYLADEERGDLVLRAGLGLPESALGHRIAPGEGMAGRVYEEARSLSSDDVRRDPRALHSRHDWTTDPPVRAFLGLPVRAGASPIGVLELVRRRPEPFGPEARGRAAIFSDAAGLLIEHTSLLAEPPPAALTRGSVHGGEPIGVATLSRRLLFTDASPTFCRMLGQPMELVVGRPALSVMPALGRPGARDALEAARRGAPGQLAGLRLDGGGEAASSVFGLSLIPIPGSDAPGEGRGLLLALQDVTARARLEARLREEGQRAREARDRLRAAIEVVTHELRTPLTSVLGYARLLQDRPSADAERRSHWAGQVIEKARMMARLMDEIAELARLDAGSGFSLQRQPVDVVALARSVAAEAAARSGRHDVQVVARGHPPTMLLDRDRIEQVLVNLVNNAVKFWPAGGTIEVRVRDAVFEQGPATPATTGGGSDAGREGRGARLTIGTEGTPSTTTDGLVVEVVDRGPGVPPHEAERVFEPFHRVERGAESPPGTGLGLAVSRAIVEAHGGRIECLQTEGGGATFRVTLPG